MIIIPAVAERPLWPLPIIWPSAWLQLREDEAGAARVLRELVRNQRM